MYDSISFDIFHIQSLFVSISLSSLPNITLAIDLKRIYYNFKHYINIFKNQFILKVKYIVSKTFLKVKQMFITINNNDLQ